MKKMMNTKEKPMAKKPMMKSKPKPKSTDDLRKLYKDKYE